MAGVDPMPDKPKKGSPMDEAYKGNSAAAANLRNVDRKTKINVGRVGRLMNWLTGRKGTG